MSSIAIVLRNGNRIPLLATLPFVAIHAACLAVFFVGFRWSWLLACLALYLVRMFFVTAGYHRYFSHRSFKTSRWFQFLLAFLASSSMQKGVLWWAGHHRHHHRHSDTDQDLHSPSRFGFWWAHVGWILSDRYNHTPVELIADFCRYPELRWMNRYHLVPPVLLAALLFAVGGWGLLVWGFCISSVFLWHGTFTINSLSHMFGRRRYATADTSKNSFLLSLITLGEGWHNNHHHYMAAVRMGFFWWEFDPTYYILKFLSWCRIVWDLRQPPPHVVLAAARTGPYSSSTALTI